MILADYHLHTDFSGDSQTPMEAMVERAISLGLKRVCFTDHMDQDYPSPEDPTLFYLDVPAAFRKMEEMRYKYRSQIEVRCGIELGMINSAYEDYRTLLRQYPFDFNIASSHLVDGEDPYYPVYWENHPDTEASLLHYLDSTLEHLNAFQQFDTYGHLDYIFRYAPNRRSYRYEEFADRLDAILRLIIELDKALEVNTGGYKYGLGVPNPQPEVLARYLELGGEKITIGSDGHAPEHLAYDFKRCEELLLSLGYKYYTVFDEHKPTMWKLG